MKSPFILLVASVLMIACTEPTAPRTEGQPLQQAQSLSVTEVLPMFAAPPPALRTILAETRFIRGTTAPAPETVSFTVADLAQFESFTLSAHAEANSEGEPLQRAEVHVNDALIFTKKDVADAGEVSTTIDLVDSNQITVEIWGPPGTAVVVEVVGTLKPVALITVAPVTADLSPGESIDLTATLFAADGTLLTGRSIAWGSSDPSVVSVPTVDTPSITALAVGPGTADVTASVDGAFGSSTIAVQAPGFLKLVGDEIRGIDVNAAGMTTAAGVFSGTLDVPGYAVPSAGLVDGFVVQYTPAGDVAWVTRLASSGTVWIWGLSPSGDGGTLITGSFTAPMTVYDSHASYPMSATGKMEGFLIRLDAQGNLVWHVAVQNLANEDAVDADTDAQGNTYFTGLFNGCCPSSGAATVRSSTGASLVLTTPSYASGFLVKVDPAGNPAWAIRAWNRDLAFVGLAVADDGTVYAGGSQRAWSSGTPGTLIDATGRTMSIPNPGIGIGFALRADTNGRVDWVTTLGHDRYGADPGGTVWDVQELQTGDIAMVGDYRDGAGVFTGTDGTHLTLPGTAGTIRSFLAVYSATGVPRQVTQISTGLMSRAITVREEGSGQILVSGDFNGQLLIPGSPTSAGGDDGFLARFSAAGLPLAGEAIGGAGTPEVAYGVDAGGLGMVGVGGHVAGGTVIGGLSAPKNSGYVWVRPGSAIGN